jgi:Fic family protein
MTIQYVLPDHWIKYDPAAIIGELTEAKAAVMSLTSIPFQRSWAEKLQEIELKREVAGTSRIEGADFTDRELDEAIATDTPEGQLNRSQRQARSAIKAYRWIEHLPPDRPLDEDLIKEVHRRIVTGCDDDHCPPGTLRGSAQNVVFGRPRHRGVEGGSDCERSLRRLVGALNQEFRSHDRLIQALALHYHLGAMHPFHDGNGRTARALEALMLQRAQLKDTLFIAMSNYYYDEKDAYLACLAEVRQSNYDLTSFLKFGLRGIATQCRRLLNEIRRHVAKSLFRDVMGQMYGRLRSTRKRALGERQLGILQFLLDNNEPISVQKLFDPMYRVYKDLKAPGKAFVRDLNALLDIGAISHERRENDSFISARLEWPTEITETEFYKKINKLPAAKTKFVIHS